MQSDGIMYCLSVRYLYHNTEALLWENRKHLLLRELREARADVSHVFSLSSSTASLDLCSPDSVPAGGGGGTLLQLVPP